MKRRSRLYRAITRFRSLAFTWFAAAIVGCAAAPSLGDYSAGETSRLKRTYDLSMMERYSPKSQTELEEADATSLAYLAKAYHLIGDEKKAFQLIRELERRGSLAFNTGVPTKSFTRETFDPPDTVYTVDLVHVADAFRISGRHRSLNKAIELLERMPTTNGGRCFAYSAIHVDEGCVHNINAIAASFLTIVGRNAEAHLAFEEETMIEPGMWYYWEEAPPERKRRSDSGHLAWSAFFYLESPNPTAQRLGRLAVEYLDKNYDKDEDFWRYRFGVAAALVKAGKPRGCELAKTLPQWAVDNEVNDPTKKSFRWAAYVHIYAQSKCEPWVP